MRITSLSQGGGNEGQLAVDVTTGDLVVQELIAPLPNVMKIDVGGHELCVLRGMRSLLQSPELRFIVVEIHRTILEQTEGTDAVKRIRVVLRQSGFSLRWIDSSHLLASRSA